MKRRYRLGSAAWFVLGFVLGAGALTATAALTTNELSAARDTYLDSNQPTSIKGAVSTITVRDLYDETNNVAVAFSMAGVPGTVTSATLRLGVPTVRSAGGSHSVYVLKRDFVESEATWNEYSSGNAWQTAGALGTADIEQPAFVTGVNHGDTAAQVPPDGIAWAEGGLDVTATVNAWLAAPTTTDLGFLIQTTGGIRSYDAKEGTTGPILELVYNATTPPPMITNELAAARDTYLDSNAPTTPRGAATTMTARDLSGETQHVAVAFSVVGLPSTVTSATLSLGVPLVRAGGGSHSVCVLKRDFVEGEATWNEYASGSAWQTAGALGTDDIEQPAFATGVNHGDTVASAPPDGIAWAEGGLDVTDTVNAWLAAPTTTDLGFLIKTTSGHRSYDTKEGTAGPTLTVEYLAPPRGTVISIR